RWRKKQVIAVVEYCEVRNTLTFTAHTQGFWRQTRCRGQIEVHDVTRNRRDRAIFVDRFTFPQWRHEGENFVAGVFGVKDMSTLRQRSPDSLARPGSVLVQQPRDTPHV